MDRLKNENKHLLCRKRHLEKSKAQVKKNSFGGRKQRRGQEAAGRQDEANEEIRPGFPEQRGKQHKAEQHSSSWEAVAM